MLDTSGSMRGTGDGQADIFERVKASVGAYVRGLDPDRVELVSFDSGVRHQRGFDRPAASSEWTAFLAGLKADGKNTYLYRSLHAALSRLGDQDAYLTTIFVLTDGIDNDPARIHSAHSALRAFAGRGALDRLHYVALGTRIPDDLRAALRASTYAAGHTYRAGQVPVLGRGNLAGGALNVTRLDQVDVPLPNGTPVSLGSAVPARLSLALPAVQDGRVRLRLRGSLAPGSAALLCAPLSPAPEDINLRPAALLLRLNTPKAPA
ncbi:VWA domain-containing protein [Deinococcus malanensis]|uniref:vWA domain-containing protein n=1 Tax=Deinococcus malanensis TaxID=1706855 RepID=UPI003638E15E